MRRFGFFAAACLLATAIAPLAARPLQDPAPPAATCDPAGIDPQSYKLTTEAQALNVLRPREPWWEPYGLWQGPREIGSVDEGAVAIAERAKELDAANLLADGQLARHYVSLAVDARKAEDTWRRVLDGNGAIVWTATLFEVDPRSPFILAFDRNGIRVYRFTQLAGDVRTHFGAPDFPGPEREAFWRALGGCLPPDVVPEAELAWRDVTAIGGTTSMLRFELSRKVGIRSDRGSRREDDTLEVILHGQAGVVDFRFAVTPYGRRPFFVRRPASPDPTLFQERVRQMLVQSFDPDGRIELPKLQRAFGW